MIAYTDALDTPIYTIAKCLNEIIVNNDLEEALQNIVDWLAETLDIDCCYISENGNKSSDLAIFTREKGITGNAVGQNNPILNIDQFPEILSTLHKNLCFKVSVNNRVSAKLHGWLRGSNLQSLLLIPVLTVETAG